MAPNEHATTSDGPAAHKAEPDSVSRAISDDHRRIAAAPLMIVGAPRSGTTWLQRLLLSDPRCCGSQESHFFVSFGRVLRDFDIKATAHRPHGLAAYWTRAELVGEIRELWVRMTRVCTAERPDATMLVDKTPDHAVWIDVISEILPAARVLHVVRDSRAVCASLISAGWKAWGAGWAPTRASAAADIWMTHVAAAEQAGATLGPTRFLRVRYEDLHAEPLVELRRIWGFLGLSCDDATLETIAARNTIDQQARPGADAIPVSGELSGEIAREPDGFFRSGSPDAWKRELGPIQKLRIWRKTGALMQRLGYHRSGRR